MNDLWMFFYLKKNINLSSDLRFNNLCKFYVFTGYDLPTCWFLRFAWICFFK